jgi:hypothetical protein
MTCVNARPDGGEILALRMAVGGRGLAPSPPSRPGQSNVLHDNAVTF